MSFNDRLEELNAKGLIVVAVIVMLFSGFSPLIAEFMAGSGFGKFIILVDTAKYVLLIFLLVYLIKEIV